MENKQKRKRYPCSFCWMNSNGTIEVESVQGFSLGSGGNWYACKLHLNEPMLRGRQK